ncbi:katanin p80 WD40 repeat-containing subunit B1 [Larimichthys crocea]|uniref:katanin p80 WD40 repeat-containing subunit B1 n=1 Tax=Larimichthys crocea TaxID=215358 RepID=UPI000F5DD2C2|nr:katanin p80 WD40 repeat-containing subunit B1 [Larimichthys crocea]
MAAAANTTKISWRLQEFEAHSSSVSCLSLGKSSGRLLATGGEDCRVNLWAVSKANCIMSLTGHKNPVECVQMNSSEDQIVTGSQSGSIRVWDMEAAKILRTLMGHKANITSLGFHPFGDFLASSSMDTNIKLWDVRRKGYVFRYTGHTQPVRSVAFSPDGKWLASASDDGTVKLWDLIQGKTITEFKSHTAAVNIVQFHPNEYLLASGSSDRTVKLWDLEKFTMIGSMEGNTTPVRCICFSPDGGCLYSGATDSLRVFGWEPDRCFDVVPVGWGKVSDLAICNQQLIGVSHLLSSVSSYVVDLKRVKKSGGSVIKGVVQDDEPLTEPKDLKGAALRRNYERPSTTCSSHRVKQRSDADRRSPEGERRSPSEDEADEKVSSAEIHNPEDYKEIFQPKNAISRTPPRMSEPFPAPPEDETILNLSVGRCLAWLLHTCPKGWKPTVVTCAKRPTPSDTPPPLRPPSAPPSLRTSPNNNRRSYLSSRNEQSGSTLLLMNRGGALWISAGGVAQIKKDSYMQTGCTSLKLIMKHFWMLISDTLKAAPSVGVDITREERHQRCRACCKQLKNLSNVVKNKAAHVGRHGSAFKELQLLMAPLDDSL